MEPSIQVQNLSKVYRLYGNPWHHLIEKLPWNKRPRHRAVHALEDVTFKVEPGQCVGLIGGNGAGKSTLLKIISGTTFPSSGSYTITGRIASLLELGAGFHPNFTGRENILMNAAMMGFSRKEAQKRIGEIIEFSDLGEFINAPIRTYSSGMAARLGFSVAIATDPDILVIDEILAVGDMNFRRKCVDKIWSFKRRGKSLFFCSHSLYDVRQLCDKAIWMRDGRMVMLDDSIVVTNEYSTWEDKANAGREQTPFEGVPAAKGASAEDEHPRILSAALVDPVTGKKRNVFHPGDDIAVRAQVRNGRPPVGLTIAVAIMRKDGTMCFAHSTQLDGVPCDLEHGHVTLMLDNVRLLSGEFSVQVWVLDANGTHRYHDRPTEQNLVIQNRTKDLGLFLQEHRWVVEPSSAKAAHDPVS
ncbi:MAG: ABC transporter ATP-binding protein [Planctomycetota bacterium]